MRNSISCLLRSVPPLCLYVGIVQFLHSFFINSVQTNNPGDLANKLSLIARLLKHCIVTPSSSHVKNSQWKSTLFFYWTHSMFYIRECQSYKWQLQKSLESLAQFISLYPVSDTSPQNFPSIHVRKDIRTFLLVNWGAICLIIDETHI